MLSRTSLTTRAFLFSFLPVCAVLAVSFAALNTLVQQHVKDGLRDSLQKSEELLDRANEDYARRISQFVPVLADSAGTKGGHRSYARGALHAGDDAPRSGAPLRRNCARCTALVGYDLLAVTDWKGRTLAAVDFGPGQTDSLSQLPSFPAPTAPSQTSVMQIGGVLYELTSTPIAIDGEQIGDLKLGARFDLSRYHLGGETVLLRNGRVLEASLPRATWASLENELRSACREARCGMRNPARWRDISGVAGSGRAAWAPDFNWWRCSRWMRRCAISLRAGSAFW